VINQLRSLDADLEEIRFARLHDEQMPAAILRLDPVRESVFAALAELKSVDTADPMRGRAWFMSSQVPMTVDERIKALRDFELANPLLTAPFGPGYARRWKDANLWAVPDVNQ
jgi:hypothetical protein